MCQAGFIEPMHHVPRDHSRLGDSKGLQLPLSLVVDRLVPRGQDRLTGIGRQVVATRDTNMVTGSRKARGELLP